MDTTLTNILRLALSHLAVADDTKAAPPAVQERERMVLTRCAAFCAGTPKSTTSLSASVDRHARDDGAQHELGTSTPSLSLLSPNSHRKTSAPGANAGATLISNQLEHYEAAEMKCCDGCQEPVRGGPMLHDDLWATIAGAEVFLCFDCTEKRLGRRLTQADLTACTFNAGWISFDGADVVAMQFARGRMLLPEEGASCSHAHPRP
jgi:hypothetical protein